MRLKHLRLITYLSGTQIVEGKTYRAWYNRGEILVSPLVQYLPYWALLFSLGAGQNP